MDWTDRGARMITLAQKVLEYLEYASSDGRMIRKELRPELKKMAEEILNPTTCTCGEPVIKLNPKIWRNPSKHCRHCFPGPS